MSCDIHPHGFSWGTTKGCVYGSKAACEELAAKFEELKMYQHAIGPLQQALERIASALEHGVERPEVRWVDADKKLNAIKTLMLDHSCECPAEWQGCLFCKLQKTFNGR